MPIFLSPRLAATLLIGLPMLGGSVVHPHGASAFLMGAWAGTILVLPPLMLILWVLRLRTLAEIFRPLMRLPILIAVSIGVLYLLEPETGIAAQIIGGGAMLFWLKRGAGIRLL